MSIKQTVVYHDYGGYKWEVRDPATIPPKYIMATYTVEAFTHKEAIRIAKKIHQENNKPFSQYWPNHAKKLRAELKE